MFLYLGILLLLASPLLSNPTLGTRQDPIEQRSNYQCFKDLEDVDHLVETYNADCAMILDSILKTDKSRAPMLISHTHGFIVPHQWVSGSCVIYIDVALSKPDGLVTLSMKGVVETALHIMRYCVNAPPTGSGLGGRSMVKSMGDSGAILDVMVIGRATPYVDPGPYPPAAARLPYGAGVRGTS